jgi:hypothetical protein
MEGKQNLNLHELNANIVKVVERLFDIYTGQSTFRDWIQAQEVNKQVEILDERATGLVQALKHGDIDPTILDTAAQQILALLYPPGSAGEPRNAALARLSIQYAKEIADLGGGSINAKAFLNAILALEKTAGLGERDKMVIYGIVTKDGDLAGAGIFAFLGFFDIRYRDHDYDWGRTVAKKLLANPEFEKPGQLGPIRYTSANIRDIDVSLTGLHLKDVSKSDVSSFKDGLSTRVNQVIKDALPNPLDRYPAQLGADLVLKLLLDWEFSRDVQE